MISSEISNLKAVGSVTSYILNEHLETSYETSFLLRLIKLEVYKENYEKLKQNSHNYKEKELESLSKHICELDEQRAYHDIFKFGFAGLNIFHLYNTGSSVLELGNQIIGSKHIPYYKCLLFVLNAMCACGSISKLKDFIQVEYLKSNTKSEFTLDFLEELYGMDMLGNESDM